jgi:hypothetical protein
MLLSFGLVDFSLLEYLEEIIKTAVYDVKNPTTTKVLINKIT